MIQYYLEQVIGTVSCSKCQGLKGRAEREERAGFMGGGGGGGGCPTQFWLYKKMQC